MGGRCYFLSYFDVLLCAGPLGDASLVFYSVLGHWESEANLVFSFLSGRIPTR